MLIKRPIYNQQLECVAVDIIANQQAKEHEHLLEHFTTLLANTEKNLLVFIPYTFKFLIEQAKPPFANPIILKLAAIDIDTICPRAELETSKSTFALVIDKPEQLAWLNFAEYIALSEHLMQTANLTKVVKFSQARQRKVIAYGLSEYMNFEHCKTMAMDYYCGNFLFQAQKTENTEIAANKFNLLELISKLQQAETDIETIVELIQTDPVLSYQLLKVVNSAAFSGFQAIESIEQAVVRLGIANLKNWVMVISMTNISQKPMELVESGLIRAHMAQKLAETQSNLCPQSAYTTGLLSVLDSLMDSPMSNLVDKITLTDEIKLALTAHKGPLGELLATVVAYEEGHWDTLKKNAYSGLDLSQIYIDCLEQVALGKKAMSEPS